MKILKTNSFIKLSINLQTHPTVKTPGDENGAVDIFDNEGDSKDEIKKKWKKKKKERSGIYLPYQR